MEAARTTSELLEGGPRVIVAGRRRNFGFPGGNPCRFPGCQAVFRNGFARRAHERRTHDPLDIPGLPEDELRRRTRDRLRELSEGRP